MFETMLILKVGIIGGSGLDDPEILEDRKEVYRETPYGIKAFSNTHDFKSSTI